MGPACFFAGDPKLPITHRARAPAACARLGRGGPEEGQFSPEKTNISTFKKDIILQQAPAYVLKVA